MHAQFERRKARLTDPGAQPERSSLAELVEAWTCGLTKVVEIPCIGAFTRRIGAHAILVTAETRASPERYSAALREFT